MKKILSTLFLLAIFVVLTFVGIAIFFEIYGNPLGVSDTKHIQRANIITIKEGISIQKHLNMFGACPEMLDGWDDQTFPPEYHFQKHVMLKENGVQSIPLWYKCKEDLTFFIWARYSIDDGLYLSGGKGKSIKIDYGHFSDRKTLDLGESPVFIQSSKILVKENLISP